MEENKIITEFMNVEIEFVDLKRLNQESFWMIAIKSRVTNNQYFTFPTSTTSAEKCLEYYNKQVRYAESWEWLMPVIDKIESMGYTFMYSKHTHDVHIGEDAHMFSARYMTTIEGKGSNKIESHYNAVINFIKQYKK